MIIPLAIGLILGGLVMAWLRSSIGNGLLSTIVYYTGIVLIIVGLILLLTPVIIWLHGQLIVMLGLK